MISVLVDSARAGQSFFYTVLNTGLIPMLLTLFHEMMLATKKPMRFSKVDSMTDTSWVEKNKGRFNTRLILSLWPTLLRYECFTKNNLPIKGR